MCAWWPNTFPATATGSSPIHGLRVFESGQQRAQAALACMRGDGFEGPRALTWKTSLAPTGCRRGAPLKASPLHIRVKAWPVHIHLMPCQSDFKHPCLPTFFPLHEQSRSNAIVGERPAHQVPPRPSHQHFGIGVPEHLHTRIQPTTTTHTCPPKADDPLPDITFNFAIPQLERRLRTTPTPASHRSSNKHAPQQETST